MNAPAVIPASSATSSTLTPLLLPEATSAPDHQEVTLAPDLLVSATLSNAVNATVEATAASATLLVVTEVLVDALVVAQLVSATPSSAVNVIVEVAAASLTIPMLVVIALIVSGETAAMVTDLSALHPARCATSSRRESAPTVTLAASLTKLPTKSVEMF